MFPRDGPKSSCACMWALEMEEGRGHGVLQDSGVRSGSNLSSDGASSSRGGSVVSSGSTVSVSSDDTLDDASSSSNSSGFLGDLSELMEHLPIKRGLSKFYRGKSESFTSFSRVKSIEDLAKKSTPWKKNMKASRSCENGFNYSYRPCILPKPAISKPKNGFFPRKKNGTHHLLYQETGMLKKAVHLVYKIETLHT